MIVGGTVGAVWFGITLRWAAAFSGPGVVLLVLLQAAFPAGAAMLTPPGRGRLLAFPGAVVLTEALRHRWPLGGLPLSSLALGQVSGPLAGSAVVFGSLGVLLLLAGAASLIVVAATRPAWPALLVTATAAAVLAGPVLLPAAIGTRPTAPPFEVAALQGGGPRGVTAVQAGPGEPARVFERHLTVAAGLAPGPALLLWPEDTVDVAGRFVGSDAQALLGNLASSLETLVIAGVIEDAEVRSRPVRRFRNAAVVVGPGGAIEDRYDKVHRVPFGEYVPWRDVVGRVVDLSLIPRDAVPGEGPGLLATSRGDLGVMISFEGLFAARARAAVRAGATVLLVPTNASSYATDDVPAQQLAAARLRAIETGRPLVMAAPTGYSAVVGPDGRVLSRSELGVPAAVRALVTPRSGSTPYVVSGDTPVVLTALLLLCLGWWRAARGRPPGGRADDAHRVRASTISSMSVRSSPT